MVLLEFPELLNEYLKFCRIRENSISNGIIDISSFDWFYRTSMLPLGNLIKKGKYPCFSPFDKVTNYISILLGTSFIKSSSFVPITFLPKYETSAIAVINQLSEWHSGGKVYGGKNAFMFLIGELIDNIYQHSEFINASVMAQKYEKKGIAEIAILDDGISIPNCFEKNKIPFEDDSKAIQKAINGFSTKSKERGYGLNSSINLYVNGLKGKLLIVSRNGAIYKEHDENDGLCTLSRTCT